MPLGTGIKNLLIINGGGGSAIALQAFNHTFDSNVNDYTDERLIDANLIALASATFGVVNSDIEFIPATGLVKKNFYADDTVTFIFSNNTGGGSGSGDLTQLFLDFLATTDFQSQLNGKLNASNVVNNLTETTTGKALDAYQGKVLNDIIVNDIPFAINDAMNQVIGGAPTDYNTLGKIATKLSAVISLVGSTSPDGDSIVNTVAEILSVFQNYPEGLNLLTALAGKVNATDIVNNLTQVASGKVLDAAQGKVLKGLIDDLTANAIVTGSDSTTTIKTLATVASYPASPAPNRIYLVESKEFYGAVVGIADGTNVVKIAHNQPFTPSFFMVNNLNSAANGITARSIDATYVYLTYASNIASGTTLNYMLMTRQ